MNNCMHRADMSDTCPHNDADPICPCRGCDLARRERIRAFVRDHEARSIARAISGSYQTTSGGNWWEASPDNDNGRPAPSNDQRPTSRPPRRDSYTPVRSYDGSCTASSIGWMDCACEWCSLRRYTNVVNACARQERQVQKTRRSCRVA